MSKPLELTTYPLLPKVGHWGLPGYIVNRKAMPVVSADYARKGKVLTDTELAAEYWLSSSRRERMLGYRDGEGSATQIEADREKERMATLERLVKSPAYDA